MFQVLDFCERGLEVFLGAEYADQGLHNLLKIAVQGVGIFSVFALKRYQQLTFGVFDLPGIEGWCAGSLCMLSCCQPGTTAEDQKV